MSKEATARSAMKLALEALEEAWYHVGTFQPTEKAIDLYDEARTALREALAEQPAQQEPAAWKWQQAPVKTQWGDDMVVASVAIDKDHTVSLYCEREQTAKVEAMFAKPAQTDWEAVAADQAMTIALLKAEQPAQRTWVNATTWRGLTDEEIDAATQAWAGAVRVSLNRLILCREFARAIEAKLKEKNNG